MMLHKNKDLHKHTLTSMSVLPTFSHVKKRGMSRRCPPAQEAVMGCLQYARLEELDDEEVKPKNPEFFSWTVYGGYK